MPRYLPTPSRPQVGAGTPLDEASAALALLCEAAQFKAVIDYGAPLLKAAAAAAPSGPAVSSPPVPDISDLVSDIAMSVAIAHVSLAASDSTPSATSITPNPAASKPGVSVGGKAQPQAQPSGLEEVYGHLEAALQVLTRHHVAEQLQHEVAHCMQGVAVAFAEEVFRSTLPMSGHVGQGHEQHLQQQQEQQRNGQAAAARRARALSILRGALWRTTTNTATNGGNGGNGHGGAVATGNGPANGGAAAAPAAGGGGGGVAAGGTADFGQHTGSTAAGSMDCWPPELSAEERAELMAPLRGLLTASEHVSTIASCLHTACV